MRADRLIAAALATAALAGCGPEFDPFHLANKFRILTIKTEPPELVIDPALLGGAPTGPVSLPEPVQITALHPPAPDATWRWDVCLVSLDSFSGFQCVDPALEVTLGDDDATATLDLVQVLGAIAGRIGDVGAQPPDAAPAGDCPAFLALPDGGCLSRLDVQIRVTAGPPGEEIVAVRTLPVWLDAEREPNRNPDVTALEVEGTPTRGGEVTLRAAFDDSSLESFVDTDGDVSRERPVFSWFTTAGELQPGATFDDDRDTTLVLPDDPAIDEVQVYVVVRDSDERRGIDFETATITLPTE